MVAAKLLSRIESFLRVSGMKPSTFGANSISDPNLVNDLRLGRELRELTRARVEKYLESSHKKWAKKHEA